MRGHIGRVPPAWIVAGAVAFAVLGLWVSGAEIWRRHREDGRLRGAALPACVARLGEEAACQEQIARHHDECARITRFHPGRHSGGRSAPRPDAYLDCVVLSPDGWVEERGRAREAREAEHRRFLP